MFAPMSSGMMISDAIINMSSLNVIAGELDA
jgi:NADH-quinone oxidoreductase subunit D